MDDYIPDQKPISLIQVWVLIALSERPGHVYGLQGRIYGASLAYVSPNLFTLRSAVKSLLKQGLIASAGSEAGRASRFQRKLYVITHQGVQALRNEEVALGMAQQGIRRALVRAAVRAAVRS